MYKHGYTNEMGLYGYERLPYTRLVPMLNVGQISKTFEYHIKYHKL